MLAESWVEWQQQVVTVLRNDFLHILNNVEANDIDWDAWRPLYDEGRSARNAVARAFANDLEPSLE